MTSSTLPTSKLARGKIVGKAMLKIGVNHTATAIKGTFSKSSKKKKSQEDRDIKNAKIIMDSLGQLKGVSVKIAQQVALSMPFLPKAYLDEMSKSFQSIPPINKALVRKIIKQELNDYPKEVFSKFELEPFGSASLGQVHYALYNEQNLAIKVQYPGIGKSIQSDISILKFALSRFAKGKNIDHVIDEISDRLYEEVDYETEVENLQFFYNNLKHPYIVVPKPIDELSTTRVLSSTLLRGMNLEQFLASCPSLELRNHYAQVLFDSFFISLYELGKIHADPNPGNFIFMDNKKLGIIDFGCVKSFNSSFIESFNRLHLSLIHKVDESDIVEQYVELNMIDRDEPSKMLEFYHRVIKPLDSIYIEIFLKDKYSFSTDNNFSKRGFDAIMKVQKEQVDSIHKINQEYIFLDRTLLGYYAIFEKMEATIDTSFAKETMNKFAKGAYNE